MSWSFKHKRFHLCHMCCSLHHSHISICVISEFSSLHYYSNIWKIVFWLVKIIIHLMFFLSLSLESKWDVGESVKECVCDSVLFHTNCLKISQPIDSQMTSILVCHYLTSPPALARWLRFKPHWSALSAATQTAKWNGSLLIWNALHSQLITTEFDIYMLLKQLRSILLNMGRIHRKWSVFYYVKQFYLIFKAAVRKFCLFVAILCLKTFNCSYLRNNHLYMGYAPARLQRRWI